MNATGTNDTATILVVEDEEIIRTSLCEFLSAEGYEVAMAESVQAARTLVHTEPFLQAGFDVAICDALQRHEVQVVCLAGYMKLLGVRTLTAFRGRILNIHPGLLPRHGGQGFYGKRVHEAALAAGDAESGATVHIVDEVYDNGPVLAQARVPVQADDTPDTLGARVLIQEHQLFSKTLQKIATGEIDLEDYS